MKKNILPLFLAITAQFSFAAVPDSLKKDLEAYDYLVSFVEENYAPFDAIMQKGYKREYKALKKQLRKQLCNGKADLERAATDYVLWFYSSNVESHQAGSHIDRLHDGKRRGKPCRICQEAKRPRQSVWHREHLRLRTDRQLPNGAIAQQ